MKRYDLNKKLICALSQLDWIGSYTKHRRQSSLMVVKKIHLTMHINRIICSLMNKRFHQSEHVFGYQGGGQA